jgi:VanZ family protein
MSIGRETLRWRERLECVKPISFHGSTCGNLQKDNRMVDENKLDRGAVAPSEKAGFDFIRSHRLWRYGPLILWAAFIFVASTKLMSASNTSTILRPVMLWLFPNTSEATLNLIHFMVRKAGHFCEYAILALLAARAFRSSTRELLRTRWFWLSLSFIVVYALSDEFHQSFVPSRTASIYDSMIDSFGGLTALALLAIRNHRGNRQDLPD